jgi:glycosyltransferase involved in cell wall biosynthesis
VGAIKSDTATALTRLAKENGVDLVVSGEVDDGTLLRAIEESDVISCLRFPSLEAASGSLVEALLNGKPTIVTDTGFYREIPSSCVMKIRPDNEVADIRSALEALFSNPTQREAMAAEGQQWASQTFTTENYVRQLIDTISEMLKASPVVNAINYFSRELAQWSPDYDFTDDNKSLELLDIFKLVN